MPRRANNHSPLLSRVLLLSAISVLVILVLYLIVSSPALLARISDDSDEWESYADMGTAYGGISAILSGLALCGIAGSLVLQRRQALIDQMAAERQRHFDIVSLSLGDPELLAAILPDASALPNVRQEVYINLMVGHWMATWRMGGMSEDNVRYNVARVFKGRVGWEWWRRIRLVWADASSASQRRFAKILDEEWRGAEKPGPEPQRPATFG